MNSLWPTEQCRQGKSANQIRNFGKRIGSKGWVGRAGALSGCRDLAGLGERWVPQPDQPKTKHTQHIHSFRRVLLCWVCLVGGWGTKRVPGLGRTGRTLGAPARPTQPLEPILFPKLRI